MQLVDRIKDALSPNAVYIDTETTGLSNDSEVIELSIIDSEGNVLFNSLIKPTLPMEPDNKAVLVHGITNSMLENQPCWVHVHNQINDLLRGKHVIAYNSEFDVRLLHQTAELNGCKLDRFKYDCAMNIFSKFAVDSGLKDANGMFFSEKRHKLVNAMKYLNINTAGTSHRAIVDTLNTLALMKEIHARSN